MNEPIPETATPATETGRGWCELGQCIHISECLSDTALTTCEAVCEREGYASCLESDDVPTGYLLLNPDGPTCRTGSHYSGKVDIDTCDTELDDPSEPDETGLCWCTI